MNATETSEVLDVIAAHYWQAVRKTDDEKVLQLATWTEVFADTPREPHVNLALAEWFRCEKWPPQASELYELALELGGPTPAMVERAERVRLDTERFRGMRQSNSRETPEHALAHGERR